MDQPRARARQQKARTHSDLNRPIHVLQPIAACARSPGQPTRSSFFGLVALTWGDEPLQRMSSADAAWLHMDRPTNLMVITGALWFDEPLDWAEVREVIAHTPGRPLPALPPAGQREPRPAARSELGGRPRLRPRPASAPHRPAGPRRPGRAAGAGRGPHGPTARPVPPAVALVPRRRLRLRLRDRRPHAPLHRRRDRAGQGSPLADRRPRPMRASSPRSPRSPRAAGSAVWSATWFAPPGAPPRSAATCGGALTHEVVELVRDPSELIDLAGAARDDAKAHRQGALLRPRRDARSSRASWGWPSRSPGPIRSRSTT